MRQKSKKLRTKLYVVTNGQTDDDDGNLVEPQFDDRLKKEVQLTNKGSTLFSARNDHQKKDLKQNDHHAKMIMARRVKFKINQTRRHFPHLK